jgi:hypothetical protein
MALPGLVMEAAVQRPRIAPIVVLAVAASTQSAFALEKRERPAPEALGEEWGTAATVTRSHRSRGLRALLSGGPRVAYEILRSPRVFLSRFTPQRRHV